MCPSGLALVWGCARDACACAMPVCGNIQWGRGGGVSIAILVGASAIGVDFKLGGRCSPVNGGAYLFSDAPFQCSRFTPSCFLGWLASVSFRWPTVHILSKGDVSLGSLSGCGLAFEFPPSRGRISPPSLRSQHVCWVHVCGVACGGIYLLPC